jgi:hypothetical protein
MISVMFGATPVRRPAARGRFIQFLMSQSVKSSDPGSFEGSRAVNTSFSG